MNEHSRICEKCGEALQHYERGPTQTWWCFGCALEAQAAKLDDVMDAVHKNFIWRECDSENNCSDSEISDNPELPDGLADPLADVGDSETTDGVGRDDE